MGVGAPLLQGARVSILDGPKTRRKLDVAVP